MRAHAPGLQGHSRAPIPGRRSRQPASRRQPRKRAPPTRPPKGTHARDRPHGQEGRRPSGAGGGPNPTEAAANTGHPQHGGPVDSTMRSAGSAADQPRDQPTMGTPWIHPAAQPYGSARPSTRVGRRPQGRRNSGRNGRGSYRPPRWLGPLGTGAPRHPHSLVTPAEVAPGDAMRKHRLRAARNRRIAARHSR